MGMDANAQANTDGGELKLWAEIWEQAKACSWVVWSELPLLIAQHRPFGT